MLSSKDQERIRISGKTVEEIGFEKINQQLSHLTELKIVLLDGLCVAGLLSESFPSLQSFRESIRQVELHDLHIVELDLSKNVFEDFAEVTGICCALKETLRALRLK